MAWLQKLLPAAKNKITFIKSFLKTLRLQGGCLQTNAHCDHCDDSNES